MRAMDDPREAGHAETDFVCWHWNDVRWPDGRRDVRYLSKTRKDIMRGYALYTAECAEAATFKTAEAANAFMAENDAMRPVPSGCRITTIAEIAETVGYGEINR